MSIVTNYIVDGIGDLNQLFVPLSTDNPNPTQANQTGYSVEDVGDLNILFMPHTTDPGTSYTITNFTVNNYTSLWTTVSGTYDLGQIFVSVTDYIWTQQTN